MKIEVDGRVKRVAKHDSGVWYVQIKVNKHFTQTYTGFTKKPKLTIGHIVHKEDEI